MPKLFSVPHDLQFQLAWRFCTVFCNLGAQFVFISKFLDHIDTKRNNKEYFFCFQIHTYIKPSQNSLYVFINPVPILSRIE